MPEALIAHLGGRDYHLFVYGADLWIAEPLEYAGFYGMGWSRSEALGRLADLLDRAYLVKVKPASCFRWWLWHLCHFFHRRVEAW